MPEWRELAQKKCGPKLDYRFVFIRLDGSKPKAYMIHRLVLEAFVGPCPRGHEACHNNGNPADNRLENLRWGTREDNLRDIVRHGTRRKGDSHGRAKLTAKDVYAIRTLRDRGFTYMEIAANFPQVHWTQVVRAAKRITWRSV